MEDERHREGPPVPQPLSVNLKHFQHHVKRRFFAYTLINASHDVGAKLCSFRTNCY